MKIAAVSACTAGIAHTYMAQEAIEQECKKRGIDCKVETQGGMGIGNELTQAEIDAADVVILAVAVSVEMSERFDAKRDAGKILDVSPSEAIKNTAGLIDRAENIATAEKQHTNLGAELFLFPPRHYCGRYAVLVHTDYGTCRRRAHCSQQPVLAKRI